MVNIRKLVLAPIASALLGIALGISAFPQYAIADDNNSSYDSSGYDKDGRDHDGNYRGGPTLQLGIAGGTYDSATQTIFSTSGSFALYAFLLPNSGNLITDTYYLSMAVTPQTSSSADLGSFTYDGNVVNVTSGMTYGTPPIDVFSQSIDPGDLARHGMFPTYFKEVGFQFDSSNQSAVFNTQDHPSWGPISGSGMYYSQFGIDVSNLAIGYEIHFDLYNTKLCTKDRGSCDGVTDTDITQFAPFSHDAQSVHTVTVIPEPETYAMLLAGLGLMGFFARRRKQNAVA